MRLTSLLITLICLIPIFLVFGGWVFPLSDTGAASWAHISATVLRDYVMGSIGLILLVALFAGSMGAVSAWYIARYDFPMRRALAWLLILPFAMPSYILAMTYGHIFEFAGPVQTAIRDIFGVTKGEYWFPNIRSLPGAALLLGLATFPYVYLVGRAAFEAQSIEWQQLASVYGHTNRFAMLRISIGAARPFLMVGIALCVMEAAADIGVTQLFGVPTLATGLYRIWYFGDEPLVAARIASLLVLIAGALLLAERLSRRRARFTAMSESNPISRIPLTGTKKWLVTFFVAMPVILGFLLPLFWTLRLALYNTRHIRIEKIIDAAGDSLYLCVLGALIAIASAFALSFSERDIRPRWRFQWIAALGYAVPGVVIALSLLILQRFMQDAFGWRLVMTGGVLGLILAYLIRFLAPAYQNVHSGFARISEEVDMMAAGFGKSKWAVTRDIYLPLLRTPMVHAFLLVAIDILKELPASLILRPFDITTLSIAVFEFAGDDRPAEAAPYALLLILFASIGVYVMSRLQKVRDDKT